MVKWHEDDEFWIKMIPVLFPPGRLEAAHGEIDAILSMVGIQGGAYWIWAVVWGATH